MSRFDKLQEAAMSLYEVFQEVPLVEKDPDHTA